MSDIADIGFGLMIVSALIFLLVWLAGMLRNPAAGETVITSVDEAYGRGQSQAGPEGGSGVIEYQTDTDSEADGIDALAEARTAGWWMRDGYQHQPAEGQTLTHEHIYGADCRGVDTEQSTDIEIVSVVYHSENGR